MLIKKKTVKKRKPVSKSKSKPVSKLVKSKSKKVKSKLAKSGSKSKSAGKVSKAIKKSKSNPGSAKDKSIKVVVVTGSVGAGKSFIGFLISDDLGFTFVDGNSIIDQFELCEEYDKQRDCKVIDEEKLAKVFVEQIKKSHQGMVIDSHMAHFIPVKYVDLCIVVKCKIEILAARLKMRNYSKTKIKENVEAEIFNVCLNEAEDLGHNVMVMDTTSNPTSIKIMPKIKKILKLNKIDRY